MSAMPIRHGDVVLIPVQAAPPKGRRAKKVELASGDSSVHSHVLQAVEWTENGERFVLARKPADITIEPQGMQWRHAPVPIEPGQAYRVVIEQRYTPQGLRRVED